MQGAFERAKQGIYWHVNPTSVHFSSFGIVCCANKTYLSEESRLCEVSDPLWSCLAFRQAQLHLQHSVGKSGDVGAWNGLVGISVPPAPLTELKHKASCM